MIREIAAKRAYDDPTIITLRTRDVAPFTPIVPAARRKQRTQLKKPSEITLRLFRAAEQGNFHVAKMLLDSGADVAGRGNSGESVLHSAAGEGQIEMLNFLLPLVGEVDVRDGIGGTPLHWAARHHKTEMARLLIEHGADPKAVDSEDRTPLHGMVATGPNGGATTTETPAPAAKKPTGAARTGRPSSSTVEVRDDCLIAQLLIEHGASVSAKDGEGLTALHAAARDGHVEMAKVLIAAKAKIDAKGVAGETPLHLAAEGGHKEMIRMLIEAGAVVDGVDTAGRTPLHRHVSARQRRKEIVDLLVASGANVNAADKKGRTVLHEAAQRNPRDPLAEILRRHGAKD